MLGGVKESRSVGTNVSENDDKWLRKFDRVIYPYDTGLEKICKEELLRHLNINCWWLTLMIRQNKTSKTIIDAGYKFIWASEYFKKKN